MKGVLVPVAPSERARSAYRALQCTSCHALGESYGVRYRLFAGPDMVLYHAVADALAGGSSAISRRACVLAPGISRLPVHARTSRTDVAVAFGIWMGVEKLKDDASDEGGWLRALVARAFAHGHGRARAVLLDTGFPVLPVEDALARQRSVEAGADGDLDVALEPTRTIASLAFGALGSDDVTHVLARDLGAGIGAILFWVDNALDLPGDLRAGRYNALARAAGPLSPADWPALQEQRQRAVDAARAELARLEPLVVMLPGRGPAELVHTTVIRGLRHQIDALAALPFDRWATSSTRDLQPSRAPLRGVLVRELDRQRERMAERAARAWHRLTRRPRMVASLAAMALFPRAAWPSRWWPDDPPAIDTAVPPPPLDTGIPVEDVPADAGDGSGGLSDWICNPCLASCGYADCDPGKGCSNCCDDACDDACDIDCSPDCDCS